MQEAVDRLLEILDLEDLEVNVFRGRSPQEKRQRVFGGQVAGQALVAACRTVERGVCHSLHAYFLRPGDVAKPILYQVKVGCRSRSSRTPAARRRPTARVRESGSPARCSRRSTSGRRCPAGRSGRRP
jgi:acyl-CoA thioesterase-2